MNASVAQSKTEKQDSNKVQDSNKLKSLIISVLEGHKAMDMTEIDMQGKSVLADAMIIVSGRSRRHVNALTSYSVKALKAYGLKRINIEGLPVCDWVLIDAGDLIIHIFCPEVREFYKLEKIWSLDQEECA